MRQFLLATFVGLMIAVAADHLLFAGVYTHQTSQSVGQAAAKGGYEFNYQVSYLLRRIP
jgi:hypothetical protein